VYKFTDDDDDDRVGPIIMTHIKQQKFFLSRPGPWM